MKQSTLDCLAIFCVILILVISSIYAGSSTGESKLYPENQRIMHGISVVMSVIESSDVAVSRLCVGETFLASLSDGHEGHYHSPQIRIMVGVINATCNKFQQYRTSN
uniref:PPM-type phosphatase domain-containing protein n=1 Tax=Schistosoma mansoni TaxID=6183 RepID=A0A5K4F886_SCHMA